MQQTKYKFAKQLVKLFMNGTELHNRIRLSLMLISYRFIMTSPDIELK